MAKEDALERGRIDVMKSVRVSGRAGGLALALSALAGSAQAQQAADAGAMPAASASDASGVGPDCPPMQEVEAVLELGRQAARASAGADAASLLRDAGAGFHRCRQLARRWPPGPTARATPPRRPR